MKKTIILHKMIIDIPKCEIRVGEKMEVDPSLIVEVHAIRAWPLSNYLSHSERKNVVKKNIGGFGCNIKVILNDKHEYYNVIESHQYIRKAMEGS